MTSVQRLVRPDDVKQATEWYFGVSVAHVPGCKSSARVARAKWVHWVALTRIGLSHGEVETVVGVTKSQVSRASRRLDLEEHLACVLARADELAAGEA